MGRCYDLYWFYCFSYIELRYRNKEEEDNELNYQEVTMFPMPVSDCDSGSRHIILQGYICQIRRRKESTCKYTLRRLKGYFISPKCIHSDI